MKTVWWQLVFLLAAVLIAAAPAAGHAAVTITVTSLSDPSASGQCTLRDAIDVALGVPLSSASDQCTTFGAGTNYTIVFASKLAGGTIQLGSELADLPSGASLAIKGPAGGGGVTINGENHQIFAVDSGATLSLEYLTLEGGFAGSGGAIANGGTLTATNSTFTNNSAPDSGSGAAIYNNGGTVTVTYSTFANNTVGEGGGGGAIDQFSGTLTVTNSTFANNTAPSGGAINQFEGTLTITNSTFANNSAAPGVDVGGGAIANVFGAVTVTNATFDGNSGPFGGAINTLDTVYLKGTILADSGGGNCIGEISDGGYNLADDGSCGFGSPTSQNNVADADLNFDPNGLQNNGGPTQTIALPAGSVAIDQIPVVDCTGQSDPPVQLTTDQRGVLRPQGPACDIGAYEYDTARSLKTAALAAIQALSGGDRHDRQELQIAASNLTLAVRYYWQGNSGNLLNPVLGILDFLAEQRAVSALQQILVPSSQLSAALIANYQFNIALADRTLAEVAISDAGGNTQAAALVAQGDAASSAGNYALAIGYYSRAWEIVR